MPLNKGALMPLNGMASTSFVGFTVMPFTRLALMPLNGIASTLFDGPVPKPLYKSEPPPGDGANARPICCIASAIARLAELTSAPVRGGGGARRVPCGTRAAAGRGGEDEGRAGGGWCAGFHVEPRAPSPATRG